MKPNVRTILLLSISIISIGVLVTLAGYKNVSRQVADVNVLLDDQHGDYFTDQLEVIDLVNDQGGDYVLGLSIGDLSLDVLEARVEQHPFIKDAQIFKDVKGNLTISVEQAKPIARIFDSRASDRYIDDHGVLLPTVTKHTSRVLIVELEHQFSWEANIQETDYGKDLLDLLRFINKDEFWRAQIAGIVVQEGGELTLLPQVTRQSIAFGMPTDYTKKFKKLKLFYTEVLPNKGWNTYKMVNVKFENQLICK